MAHNLRTHLTSFIGREAELLEIRRLVGQHRLVTLTGVGGVGKTRLAERLGSLVEDDWPDGFWLVDLGSVSDADEVGRLTAATAGVLIEPDGDPVQALAAQAGRRRMVLCLDTCEHVLDAAAALAETVLGACPAVSIVATSREPLGVSGEAVWRVPSLSPHEAVELFAERAELAVPGFDVAAAMSDVESICARVDRIPLGIELAAAWVRALTPWQIVAGLEDSLRLLVGARRAIPRHQTLLASISWSHALLDDEEKAFFQRLAVFTGTFTLEAAAQVSADLVAEGTDGPQYADALHVLGRLLDKSLVVAQEYEPDVRYRMLDTIRQYAEQQLRESGEAEQARDRHLDYFLRLALDAAAGLGSNQDRSRVLLEDQRDNIGAALRWALAAPHERVRQGRRLAAAMVWQWLTRGQAAEGLDFLRRAIELDPQDRSAEQAQLLVGTAMMGMVMGRGNLVEDAARTALEIATAAGDATARARALTMSAYPLFFRDFEACHAAAERARAAGEAAGDPFARDWAAVVAGYSLQTRARNEEAAALARRTFQSSWAVRDRFCAAFARGLEAYVLLVTGHVQAAVEMGEEVVSIVAPLGDYFAVGTNTCTAAQAAVMGGHVARARQLLEPVRTLAFSPGADVVGFMVPYGLLHMWEGDLEGAVGWFERGARRINAQGTDWIAARCLPGLVAALRRLGRLDEAAALAAEAIAVETGFGAVYELSAVLDEQARMMREQDPDAARSLHLEALALRRTHGLRTCYVDSLDALAWVEAHTSNPTAAARLLATSDAGRHAMGYPRPPADAAGHDALIGRLRTELGDDVFGVAWSEGTARATDHVAAALTRGRGPRDRPASGWDSLTPTELEVVRLVRRGLSNPEIAQRLYVSRSTVKAHLARIFAKVGTANRTELALRAAEHELAGP